MHNEGSNDEERIVTEAHIQAKSGFFEIDTPIYDGDIVDVGVDPRNGSRDRRLVTNLKLNQVTGRSSNIQHTQVDWAKAPAPRVAAVRRLTFENLHPDVLKAAGAFFADGHHRTAVAEAFKSIEVRVRKMTGIENKSASPLMGDAFKAEAPLIDVATESGQSGMDERQGFLALFRGSMLGIRNPNAHELAKPADAQEALEYLAFASLLHRRIDQAAKIVKPSTP